jgi:ABC-2 type transport system ATP-binding protein
VTDTEPVLKLRAIDKRFRRHRVLSDLNLTVTRGEIVGLLGPNGSGKTTTLRLAAGYLWPDSGRVFLNEQALTPESTALRQRIGYLPERIPLYDPLTVRQQLVFVARARGLRGAAVRSAVTEAAAAFDLEPVIARVVGRLSKGFRQRVGLAQALLGEPDLLLLDEPTSGLDPFQILEAREMIRRASAHRAVIVSTHIVQEISALCSRVVYLREGRLVELERGVAAANHRLALIATADEARVLEAVSALDPAIAVISREARADARSQLVFDLTSSATAPAALARRLTEVTALEQFAPVEADLESALVAAMRRDQDQTRP